MRITLIYRGEQKLKKKKSKFQLFFLFVFFFAFIAGAFRLAASAPSEARPTMSESRPPPWVDCANNKDVRCQELLKVLPLLKTLFDDVDVLKKISMPNGKLELLIRNFCIDQSSVNLIEHVEFICDHLDLDIQLSVSATGTLTGADIQAILKSFLAKILDLFALMQLLLDYPQKSKACFPAVIGFFNSANASSETQSTNAAYMQNILDCVDASSWHHPNKLDVFTPGVFLAVCLTSQQDNDCFFNAMQLDKRWIFYSSVQFAELQLRLSAELMPQMLQCLMQIVIICSKQNKYSQALQLWDIIDMYSPREDLQVTDSCSIETILQSCRDFDHVLRSHLIVLRHSIDDMYRKKRSNVDLDDAVLIDPTTESNLSVVMRAKHGTAYKEGFEESEEIHSSKKRKIEFNAERALHLALAKPPITDKQSYAKEINLLLQAVHFFQVTSSFDRTSGDIKDVANVKLFNQRSHSLDMLPGSKLLSRPINIQNSFIFERLTMDVNGVVQQAGKSGHANDLMFFLDNLFGAKSLFPSVFDSRLMNGKGAEMQKVMMHLLTTGQNLIPSVKKAPMWVAADGIVTGVPAHLIDADLHDQCSYRTQLNNYEHLCFFLPYVYAGNPLMARLQEPVSFVQNPNDQNMIRNFADDIFSVVDLEISESSPNRFLSLDVNFPSFDLNNFHIFGELLMPRAEARLQATQLADFVTSSIVFYAASAKVTKDFPGTSFLDYASLATMPPMKPKIQNSLDFNLQKLELCLYSFEFYRWFCPEQFQKFALAKNFCSNKPITLQFHYHTVLDEQEQCFDYLSLHREDNLLGFIHFNFNEHYFEKNSSDSSPYNEKLARDFNGKEIRLELEKHVDKILKHLPENTSDASETQLFLQTIFWQNHELDFVCPEELRSEEKTSHIVSNSSLTDLILISVFFDQNARLCSFSNIDFEAMCSVEFVNVCRFAIVKSFFALQGRISDSTANRFNFDCFVDDTSAFCSSVLFELVDCSCFDLVPDTTTESDQQKHFEYFEELRGSKQIMMLATPQHLLGNHYSYGDCDDVFRLPFLRTSESMTVVSLGNHHGDKTFGKEIYNILPPMLSTMSSSMSFIKKTLANDIKRFDHIEQSKLHLDGSIFSTLFFQIMLPSNQVQFPEISLTSADCVNLKKAIIIQFTPLFAGISDSVDIQTTSYKFLNCDCDKVSAQPAYYFSELKKRNLLKQLVLKDFSDPTKLHQKFCFSVLEMSLNGNSELMNSSAASIRLNGTLPKIFNSFLVFYFGFSNTDKTVSNVTVASNTLMGIRSNCGRLKKLIKNYRIHAENVHKPEQHICILRHPEIPEREMGAMRGFTQTTDEVLIFSDSVGRMGRSNFVDVNNGSADNCYIFSAPDRCYRTSQFMNGMRNNIFYEHVWDPFCGKFNVHLCGVNPQQRCLHKNRLSMPHEKYIATFAIDTILYKQMNPENPEKDKSNMLDINRTVEFCRNWIEGAGCAPPNNCQVFTFLYGPGGTGKSAMTDHHKLMHDSEGGVYMENSTFEKSGFGLIAAKDATMMLIQDSDGGNFSMPLDIFKQFAECDGMTQIKMSVKFKNPEVHKPKFAAKLGCINSIPENFINLGPDEIEALRRRLIVVHMDKPVGKNRIDNLNLHLLKSTMQIQIKTLMGHRRLESCKEQLGSLFADGLDHQNNHSQKILIPKLSQQMAQNFLKDQELCAEICGKLALDFSTNFLNGSREADLCVFLRTQVDDNNSFFYCLAPPINLWVPQIKPQMWIKNKDDPSFDTLWDMIGTHSDFYSQDATESCHRDRFCEIYVKSINMECKNWPTFLQEYPRKQMDVLLNAYRGFCAECTQDMSFHDVPVTPVSCNCGTVLGGRKQYEYFPFPTNFLTWDTQYRLLMSVGIGAGFSGGNEILRQFVEEPKHGCSKALAPLNKNLFDQYHVSNYALTELFRALCRLMPVSFQTAKQNFAFGENPGLAGVGDPLAFVLSLQSKLSGQGQHSSFVNEFEKLAKFFSSWFQPSFISSEDAQNQFFF